MELTKPLMERVILMQVQKEEEQVNTGILALIEDLTLFRLSEFSIEAT
jgi:co-chaperonin GroES (HSP10)